MVKVSIDFIESLKKLAAAVAEETLKKSIIPHVILWETHASPNASHNVSTQQRKYRREISQQKILRHVIISLLVGNGQITLLKL